MLNILARKREEELSKAKAKKDAIKSARLVNVSKAAAVPNLKEKKLEHDRLNAHYLQLQPGMSVPNPELERQRSELDMYYTEKRRTLLVKLLSALQLGADVHFAEQKNILWKEYHEEFLPHLLDTMYHIIIDNARIVFSTNSGTIGDNKQQFYSKMPCMAEGSLHEQISLNVAVFLEESMKKVLQATEEQCAQLTLRSMDIMTKTVLDIEDYWKQKTLRDVENFHLLKMQEMSYKIDEERDLKPTHWSENLVSPQHGRRATRDKLNDLQVAETENSTPTAAEHDKYYLYAQRVKKDICEDVKLHTQAIRMEHYCSLNNKHVDEITYCTDTDPDTDAKKKVLLSRREDWEEEGRDEGSEPPSSLQSCYSNVAEMRRMNLEANLFLQRMKSVSMNMKAEYDALERALSITPSFDSYDSDIDHYVADVEELF